MSIAKGFIFNLVLGAYWRKNREIGRSKLSFIIDLVGLVNGQVEKKSDVRNIFTTIITNKIGNYFTILCLLKNSRNGSGQIKLL